MALQQVNFGSASDGSQGDTARAAFGKINQNFSDQSNAAARLIGLAAGNAMEVGAFGLGAKTLAMLANIDDMTLVPGWYQFSTGTSTGTAPTAYGVVLIASLATTGSTSNWANQTFYGTNGRIYWRSSVNLNAWSVWREIYDAGASPVFGAALTLQRTSAGATQLNIGSLAGNYKTLSLRSSDSARWNFGCNDAAEAGSNAGSNFFMFRMNDSGAYLGTPLQISRQTGLTTLESLSITGPVRPGQYTLASLPSASAFTGYEIDVTDAAGGAKRCRSDGTNWKILNTTTTVS